MDLGRHTVPALLVAVVALAVAVVVLATRGSETETRTSVADAMLAEAFSEQQAKGQDSAAKSDARNAVSELESCYVDQMDYSACVLPSDFLDVGPEPGQVEIVDATPETYTITAHSESGAEFVIVKQPNFTIERTCSPAGAGGCSAAGDW